MKCNNHVQLLSMYLSNLPVGGQSRLKYVKGTINKLGNVNIE